MKILVSLSSANLNAFKKALVEICRDYQKPIPIKSIDAAARKNGLCLIDEDGSDWEGILTGADGRCSIQLAEVEPRKPLKQHLQLQWHKMSDRSGVYEINAYVS